MVVLPTSIAVRDYHGLTFSISGTVLEQYINLVTSKGKA